jgi:hypothetical protein
MDDKYLKALHDIPRLIQFVDELIVISDSMTQVVKFDFERDHLALMSLCFVSKQIEHLRSVRILVDAKQNRDAGLIARSMIEGLCVLLWAAREPQTRPLRWKSYAWVEDYKLMLKKEKAGVKVEPAYKLILSEQLRIYGTQFFTKKAKDELKKGSPLPRDPYINKWIEKGVNVICDEVEGTLLYEKIYRETSQWIHWTIRGLSPAISRKDLELIYINESADIGATALASGFQSLFESSKFLDSHLTLGFGDKLDKILNDYRNFHCCNEDSISRVTK